MRERRVGMCRVEMGWLLKDKLPEVGGWRPRRRERRVDFPEPEAPTRAMEWPPWGIVRVRDLRMGWVGWVG